MSNLKVLPVLALIAFLVVLVVAKPAAAQEKKPMPDINMLDSQNLHQILAAGDANSSDWDQQDYNRYFIAIGYVSGVAHTAILLGRACPHGFMSNGAVAKIVVDFLSEHPEERSEPSPKEIFRALSKSFPCKEGEIVGLAGTQ
jgi:hypothetical protein